MPKTKLAIRKDFSAMRKVIPRKSEEGKPKIFYRITKERREMARACQTESPQALLNRSEGTKNYKDRIYIALVMARSIISTTERNEAIYRISNERNRGEFQNRLSLRYPYTNSAKYETGRQFASDLDQAVRSRSSGTVRTERKPDIASIGAVSKGGDMSHGEIRDAILVPGVGDWDQQRGPANEEPDKRYERIETKLEELDKTSVLTDVKKYLETGETGKLNDELLKLRLLESEVREVIPRKLKQVTDVIDAVDALIEEKRKDKTGEEVPV